MLDRCKRGVKPRCIDCRYDGVYTAECSCRADYVETQHASETGVFLSVDGSAGSKRFHTTKHHLSPAATGLDASHSYVAFRHCIDLHPLPPHRTQPLPSSKSAFTQLLLTYTVTTYWQLVHLEDLGIDQFIPGGVGRDRESCEGRSTSGRLRVLESFFSVRLRELSDSGCGRSRLTGGLSGLD